MSIISSFKGKVYEVVRNIPKGKTASYGEVAQMANAPRAARAVGTLMAKNKDKNVPCHRVINSSGRIGRYNGGGEQIKKEKLLEEGVSIRGNKVLINSY